jgi:hypothetical protein
MSTITGFKIEDLRFPTSLTGDGTDAMNKVRHRESEQGREQG